MKNTVKILSPGQGCWKTRKIIKSLEKFFVENNIPAEFIIIDEADKYLEYRTWILPTIIINDKIVARGYRPSNDKIINHLKIK